MGSDGCLELREIYRPVRCGGVGSGAIWRRSNRDVFGDAAGHLDIGDILVEKGFEHDDFVAFFDEGHHGGEDAFIGASGNGDLRVWIDGRGVVWRVSGGESFFQAGTTFSRRVLVALNLVEGVFGSVDYEVGRIVATCLSSAMLTNT